MGNRERRDRRGFGGLGLRGFPLARGGLGKLERCWRKGAENVEPVRVMNTPIFSPGVQEVAYVLFVKVCVAAELPQMDR